MFKKNFAEHLQFYTFNTFTSDTQVLPEYLGLAGVWDGANGIDPIALISKLIPSVATAQKCQCKHLAMG